MRLSKAEHALFSPRHIRRYRQIATVLLTYGFGDIVERLHLGSYLALGMRLLGGRYYRPPTPRPLEERLRLACEALGPTFIKLGQILSTRPDLIPLKIAQELARLQDMAPPFPAEEAKRIIAEELACPLREIFATFGEAPVAAASMAQVHRARLVTGEDVAVKVRRPGIEETIDVDLAILFHLASLLERHVEEISFYRPTLIVDEFARTIRNELTFTVEGAHAERFARLFSHRPEVRAPHIFRQATTDRVLTMTYLEGVKITDLATLTQRGYDPKRIADRGAEVFLEQIFVHGYFHADPHPGNILILPGEVLGFLDFGMMGYLDDQTRENLMEILIAFTTGNAGTVTEAMLAIAEYDDEPDRRRLTEDLATFMDVHVYRPLKQFRIVEAMRDILDITYRHRFRLPPVSVLMLKVLSQLEAIGRVLDPDFDLPSRIYPFVLRQAGRRTWSKRLQEAFNLWHHATRLPEELSLTLRALRQGKITVTFSSADGEKTATDRTRAANRLAVALILAAVIVASSLFIASSVGPAWGGYSLLGLIGFGIAGLIGAVFLVSLLRSGLS